MRLQLLPLYHRGAWAIGLIYPNCAPLSLAVRKLAKVKWTQTHKCWYVPMSVETHKTIISSLQGLTSIDDKRLVDFLSKEKAINKTKEVVTPSTPIKPLPIQAPAWELGTANLLALNQFMQILALKAYSPSTIRTYRGEFMQLLKVLKHKPVNDLLPEDLRRYMVYVMKNGLSENGAHSRINAIKFYFEQVLYREKFFWEIPRPKKREDIPKIFSKEEVAAILNSVINSKQKTMLMLAYSAGLRVSEVIGLHTQDIDSHRMTIRIQNAKGKKDRMVALSPLLLVMLRHYATAYKPNKQGYLFEGRAFRRNLIVHGACSR